MCYKRPLELKRFTQRKNSEGRFSNVMIKKMGENRNTETFFYCFIKTACLSYPSLSLTVQVCL